MSFESYGSAENEGTKTKRDIDWQALNQYTVETAGLQEPETLVGVIAGIVDLGTQEQPDSEVVFTGDADDESDEIDKNPNTYFKDGFDPQTRKPARLKCWPNKPIQSVAVAVDFPDILLDKAQFFGSETEPKPLRLWLGDTFYTKEFGSVVARPTPLKVVNIDKEAPKPKWSFSPLHLFYKMAVGTKLIKPGDVFLPEQIDQLIGEAMQFQVQVYMRPAKDGKEYFTEKIKFVGGLGRGQVAPENPNEPFLVQFNQENPPEALKNLRQHVTNTIKRAKNYNGSAIQKQLGDEVKVESEPKAEAPKAVAVKTPAKTTPKTAAKAAAKPEPVDYDTNEDDLPF
jgi:hypothetical protein